MKCIECGHELKDGAVFCIRCGAMQVSKNDGAGASATTPAAAPVRPAASNVQNANGRHTKDFKPTPRRSAASVAVPIVAAVAVLAAVAALVVFVINPGSSGQDSSTQASNAQVTTTTSDSSASTSSSASSTSSSASSTSASSKSKSSSSASASSASSSTTTGKTSSTNTSTGNTSTNGSTNNSTNNSTNQGATTVQPEPVYTDDTYYLWDTSDRYYSRAEVENLSNYDLYYARNEIFARHGRMFNNADLQNYFNSKSWYNPVYSPAEFDSMGSVLSDIEESNVKLMLQVEQDRNSPYL